MRGWGLGRAFHGLLGGTQAWWRAVLLLSVMVGLGALVAAPVSAATVAGVRSQSEQQPSTTVLKSVLFIDTYCAVSSVRHQSAATVRKPDDLSASTGVSKKLTDLGYTVTLADELPTNLASYGSIWYASCENLSQRDQKALEAFVDSGRGLYLTGAPSDYYDYPEATETPVAQALTGNRNLYLGGLNTGYIYDVGASRVNSNAAGGVATKPYRLPSSSSMFDGAVTGISAANTLASAPFTTGRSADKTLASVAVFPASSLVDQRGALLVDGRSAWAVADAISPTEAKWVANFEEFLTGGYAPRQPNALAGGARYVALGDSYSSGESNPPYYDNGGPDNCDRSEHGYADIIAKDLGLSYGGTAFDFEACSGATIGDLWSGSTDARGHSSLLGHEVSGLVSGEAGLGPNTRLVTLTIGGNDVNFSDIVETCVVLNSDCPWPVGWFDAEVGDATQFVNALQPTLVWTYEEIKRRAPNAARNIYVLGYPQIFTTNYLTYKATTCHLSSLLSYDTMVWLYDLQLQLNSIIKTAARLAGVHYVDPNAAGASYSFIDHDICSPENWFSNIGDALFQWHYMSMLHPNAAGQRAMAAALVAAGATKVNVSGNVARPAATGAASAAIAGSDAAALAAEHRSSAAAPADSSTDPDDASISGTLSSAAGPLSGVAVDVYDSDGGLLDTELTGGDGSYTVSGLPAGDYTLQFDASDLGYVSQYYGGADADSAATVTVAQSQALTGVDQTLTEGGTIAGTVSDSAGNPISGVEVDVESASDDVTVATGLSGSDGTYSADGLPAGSYIVQFDPEGLNYLGDYYGGASDPDSASAVTVAAGATNGGVDATLAAGASVTGTVTDSTGAAVGGINVDVVAADGSGTQVSALADPDGTYSVSGLPVGSYDVVFADGNSDYAPQYYNDESDGDSADALTLTAGQTATSINASLTASGSISGTVTDANGEPLAGVTVLISSTDGSSVGDQETTASDGTYTASGLVPGSYDVEFEPSGQNYVEQSYNSVVPGGTPTAVTVSAGATTAAVNASLTAGASVSGTITGAGGTAAAGVEVVVKGADGEGGMATTAADGSYSVVGLPAGNYTVEFEPTGLNYLDQYYDAQSTAAGAQQLTLAAGQLSSGIDATLTAGGSISGTVTDNTGTPLEGIDVEASSSDCSTAGAEASTDANGDYTLPGLPAGSYKLLFDPAGGAFGADFYPAMLSVSDGTVLSDVNTTLSPDTTDDASSLDCSDATPGSGGTTTTSTTTSTPGTSTTSTGTTSTATSGTATTGAGMTGTSTGSPTTATSSTSPTGTSTVGTSLLAAGKLTVARVRIAGTQLKLLLRCAGSGSCSATFALSVRETLAGKRVVGVSVASRTRRRVRTVVVGLASVTLNGGSTEVLTVRLSATGRQLLARYRRLPVRLTATAGTLTVLSQRLTFRVVKHWR